MVRLRFYPKRRVAAGRRRAGRAGMTMVEVLVAAMIGVILSAALMSFAVYMAKLSKSTFSQMKFCHYTKQTIERIAKVIRYAKRIEVKNNGTELYCTDERDITSEIYYNDADNDPQTLSNNKLYYVPDINNQNSQPEVIGRYISPFAGTPIFQYRDRTSAVVINFRVGDPSADPGARFQSETGPGPQGVDVHTAFGPRNSYLD